MTFEYVVPGETVVKRLFLTDRLQDDSFAVIVDDDNICEISYDLARQYWIGSLTLQELINHDAA